MYEALCLPSRARREGNRDRLCFLSHGDFAFSVPLLLGWLAERVSAQPHPVPQFLYIFWTRRAKCTFFFPHAGKCQERKTYKTSVREAASPPLRSLLAAERKAECSHLKLQNKENKLAGTHSGVPEDYFCVSWTSSQPVPPQSRTALWRPHRYDCILQIRHLHFPSISFLYLVHPYSRVQESKNPIKVILHLW